jgi:hypothetical protein
MALAFFGIKLYTFSEMGNFGNKLIPDENEVHPAQDISDCIGVAGSDCIRISNPFAA